MPEKKSKEFIEPEFAFRLRDTKNFQAVLEKLWTAGGLIDLDGVMAARVGESIKESVHIFSARTEGDEKERLRLSADKNGLNAKLDRKCLSGRVKYEKTVERSSKKKDILRLMKKVQPMISLFCKERAILVYKFMSPPGCDRYVKIGIDRIVPVSLSGVRVAGCAPFYDLDIEGDGSGSERQFVSSRFFSREVLGLLVPLERSTAKWRIAREAGKYKSKARKYRTYEDVLLFFNVCTKTFKRAFPEGHALVGHRTKR